MTLGVNSLLGQLASLAQSVNLQGAAQHCELSQAGSTLEQLLHSGYLEVMYPSAADAKDMMMRGHVPVIARKIVQYRYLARLSRFAKLLQNPMDCGQGYVGMRAAYCHTDLMGARMVLRSEQRPYDREPLRCDSNPPLTTSRDELAKSLK